MIEKKTRRYFSWDYGYSSGFPFTRRCLAPSLEKLSGRARSSERCRGSARRLLRASLKAPSNSQLRSPRATGSGFRDTCSRSRSAFTNLRISQTRTWFLTMRLSSSSQCSVLRTSSTGLPTSRCRFSGSARSTETLFVESVSHLNGLMLTATAVLISLSSMPNSSQRRWISIKTGLLKLENSFTLLKSCTSPKKIYRNVTPTGLDLKLCDHLISSMSPTMEWHISSRISFTTTSNRGLSFSLIQSRMMQAKSLARGCWRRCT